MSSILDLAISISLADHISSGVRNIISQFRLLEGATQQVQDQMNRLRNISFAGGALAAVGTAGMLATAAAAKEAVSKAGDLQEVMTEIKSLTFGKDLFDPSKANEITQKMHDIQNLTTRLGLETTFSNLDAGRVFVELQKGGIQYQDIMNGAAEATIKFAQLNKMVPESAAELMVQTRAGFQLTGQQMLEAADTVTKVAAASSANAEDINRGLGNMAGVATRMWLNRSKAEQVLDSSVLVALTRTQTPEGASAGTFVRNFLERLVPQTKKQTEMMAEVGWLDSSGKSIFLDYAKDPRGQLKAAKDIAEILRKTVGGGKIIADEKEIGRQFELAEQGMGTDKLIKLFHKVFGEQGGRTAYTLLRTGEGSLEEIQDGLINQLSLNERVSLQMQNFNQIMDTAKESWVTSLTVLGTPLLDGTSKMFNLIRDELEVLTKYFDKHPQVSKYIFAIAGGVSAFLAIGGAITVVVTSFRALQLALSVAGITFGKIALFSGGAVLAIAAVAGIAYLVYKNWDTIRPLLVGFWNTIKSAIMPAFNEIKNSIMGAWNAVRSSTISAWTTVKSWFITNMPLIKQAMANVWLVVGPLIKNGVQPAIAFLKGAWSVIKSSAKLAWDYIVGVIKIAWDIVSGIIVIGCDILTGKWGKAWTDIKNMFSDTWTDMKSTLGNLGTDFYNLGANIISMLVDGIKSMATSPVHAVQEIWSNIKRSAGIGGSVSVTSGETGSTLAKYASGGIITSSHLGLVGEAGPEVIIPLSLSRRGGALALWQRAGEMLGIPMHAEGGFFGGIGNFMSNAWGGVKGFFGSEKIQNSANNAEYAAVGLESSRTGYEKAVHEIHKDYVKKIAKTNTIEEADKVRRIAHQAKNLARGFSDITKTLSRLAIPLALFASASEIISANDKKQALAKELGSSLGSIGVGALTGAVTGSLVGAGVLSPLTALIGAAVGAGLGSFGGQALAGSMYDNIARFAAGTDSAPGGLAWVGEKGPELMNVPRGSQITPNHRLSDVLGRKEVYNHGDVTINIYQQPGEDSRVLAERVADILERRSGFKAQQARLTIGRHTSFQGV